MSNSLNFPSKQLLLQAINRANTHQFTFDEIEFEAPTLTTEYGRNTVVNVVAKESFDHCGTVPVYYYRLDLGELFTRTCSGKASLDLSGQMTVGDIVNALNQKYLIHLEQVDILEPFSTVVNVAEGDTVKITAAAGSYAYIGIALVHFGDGGLTLDMVIGDKLLDGLLYYNVSGSTNMGSVIGDQLLEGLDYHDVTP